MRFVKGVFFLKKCELLINEFGAYIHKKIVGIGSFLLLGNEMLYLSIQIVYFFFQKFGVDDYGL